MFRNCGCNRCCEETMSETAGCGCGSGISGLASILGGGGCCWILLILILIVLFCN